MRAGRRDPVYRRTRQPIRPCRPETFLKAQPAVAEVEYVSKERALERFRADFPELRDVTTSVGQNPFPAALEVRLRTENGGDAAADVLARDVGGRPGVVDVRYDRRWLERLVGIVRTARFAAALAAGILMLGAAFTVAAVVRLSLYARRDELEIMQLVGAPFSYIRGRPSSRACCSAASAQRSP